MAGSAILLRLTSKLMRALLSVRCAAACDVQKALMAPGIPAKSNKKSEAQPVMQNAAGTPAAELTQMIRKLRKHVEENSEYVGPRFAEEARKIHYEESEARGIYGEASSRGRPRAQRRRHRRATVAAFARRAQLNLARNVISRTVQHEAGR